jgi:DNA repair protein RecN (Recombination protein N)
LAKVASGGERARFMFSLKALDALRNELSMLILDEIDIGISGKTAAKVAKKMKELSKVMQLIVITHLPQVAARADHHYEIIKIKEDDRMVTRISHLDLNKRIEAIALMLSDEKLSTYAIEQAKMLLDK